MSGEMVVQNGTRPVVTRRLSLGTAVGRHKLLAFGTPLAVLTLTVLFVLWVPPIFETSTDVRVDEERSGVAVLEALQTLSQGSEVSTEMAVLRSRSLAEAVADQLGVQLSLVEPTRTLRSAVLADLNVERDAPQADYTLERVADGRYRVTAVIVHPRDGTRPFARPATETRALGEASVGAPLSLIGATVTLAPAAGERAVIGLHVATFDDAVEELQEALVVSRPDREANVVRVSYRAGDPELVQSVANTLARTFIERRQGFQSSEARNTVGFLDDQLDALTRQLGASEEELRAFRERHRIVSVEDEAGEQVARLAQMRAERDIMETERAALSRLMEEVRGEAAQRRSAAPGATPAPGQETPPYRRLLAFPSLFRVPVTGELLGQIAELENQVSQALMGRTPQDRDVQIQLARIDELDSQLQAIAETYLESLNEQVAGWDRELGAFQTELARIPAAEMDYIRLRREVDLLSQLYTTLQLRRKEAEIVAAVQDESVRVVDAALYPTVPVRPRPWLSVFLALVVGSVMGLGGALAREHTDRSVRDRRDLGRVTGTSVLGLIPQLRIAGWRNGNLLPVPWGVDAAKLRPHLVDRMLAGDPAVEAYRSLRTNLLFSRIEAPPRAVVFTSPMPGDGKSTTAANLALVLAQQGNRILLIDADMRRGVLHEVLGAAREPGLSEVLLGRVPLSAAMVTVEPRDGVKLDFLPSGVWPPNPSELIASPAMRALLQESLARYEMLILDAPPLNLVTEAAVLGTYCDGVILVARAGITEESPLEYAVEQLRSVRAPLLGTVLNGIQQAHQDYYGARGRRAYAYFRKS
jgi:tyrosine-protein kinase Etk/Wzc